MKKDCMPESEYNPLFVCRTVWTDASKFQCVSGDIVPCLATQSFFEFMEWTPFHHIGLSADLADQEMSVFVCVELIIGLFVLPCLFHEHLFLSQRTKASVYSGETHAGLFGCKVIHFLRSERLFCLL